MSKKIEVKYKILAEHLLWVEESLLDELVNFLEEKLRIVVSHDNKYVLIGLTKGQEFSKRTLKVYIKRFLHKFELLDRLRVISGGKDSYIIHKRRGIAVTRL